MGMKSRRPKFDEALAERVRVALGPRGDVIEKRMFGGLCFMVRGHMTVGIEKTNLMVRTGPDNYEDALAQPHARPMDFTGRPLRGFVYVEPGGVGTDRELAAWVKRGLAFAESQPTK
jgi:TfoX/Sxy family transcriptional regulator of competence genes